MINIKNHLWLLPFCSFILGYITTYHFFYRENIASPDLIGKYVHEVLPILSQNKLNARIINQKEENMLPEGIIINQIPQAGKIIKPHQSIFMIITKKPPAIQAPTYIGCHIDTLLTQMEKMNFNPHIYKLTHTYPENICFAQNPDPTENIENKKLILYISAGTNKAIIWPRFIGIPLPQVIEFLDNYDIKPYIINDSSCSLTSKCCNIVTEQRPLAGTLIILDKKNPLSVQLRIQ